MYVIIQSRRITIAKIKIFISWVSLKIFGEGTTAHENEVSRGIFGRCFDQVFMLLLRALDYILENDPRQYLKIILSFFQVAGNLFMGLETPWPGSLVQYWKAFEFLTMEIFNLPGYDCVFADYNSLQRLQITTITPI